MHVLGLGKRVKASLQKAGLTGYQFGSVGVSDGISMGTFGMSYSLQSRDLIADQVETAAAGHWLDGMVTIPACDKNMPGVLMALGRLNRPGLMSASRVLFMLLRGIQLTTSSTLQSTEER